MSIRPIKQNRISDEVLSQIKDHIISGEWQPGKKIPGELELAGLFGVSRVSIREAIHRLSGMGVLSIRRGEGTFVNEILPRDYFNALLPVLMIDNTSLTEMLEFRIVIEVESVRLASLRADEEDIGRMEEILEKMKKSQGDYKEFSSEDLNFHTALALASHNSVFVKVIAILHDMLKVAMDEIVNLTGFEGGIYYHEKILKAIIEKNESQAVEIMKEHIKSTITRIKELKENSGIGK